MDTTISNMRRGALAMLAAGTLIAGCADGASLAPGQQPALSAQDAALPSVNRDNDNKDDGRHNDRDTERTLATLRRATDRYHDLEAAKADGFVFLHGCEVRGDEGAVGTVYVHMGRLTDGVIDPARPDGLVYVPSKHGRLKLAAVEMAIPYAQWTSPTPPALLGAAFQREDEFGVFALHVWIWKHNPEGLFAESHPKVTCAAE